MKWIFTIFVFSTIILFAQEPIDTDGDGFRNISTLEQLRWVSENEESWSWSFELDNDIDARDTKNWNNEQGFSPIGNEKNKFNGQLDGNGFKIDSLFILRSHQTFVGFFGYAVKAQIINIGITNCIIEGNLNVGGLIGYNLSCSIISSYCTGTVHGINYIGGLIGINKSNIINSYSRCNVEGENYVGGLVGSNFSYINYCFSTGKVDGEKNTGGLIGKNWDSSEVNGFWDIETSGQLNSSGGKGKTTTEMKTKSTYIDAKWNFEHIWQIEEVVNEGYPYILDRNGYLAGGIEPIDTDDDGYRNVSSLKHIVWICVNEDAWNLNYELDNDINAENTKYWIDSKGFIPIGNKSKPFTGNFNGNGYKIDALYISGNKSYSGLFGYTFESEITNVGVTNCNINGGENVGGLIGYSNFSNINYCYTTGEIEAKDFIGGIIGRSWVTKINNSYSHCNVTGSNWVGGIIGDGCIIINSYSSGKVIGDEIFGALAAGSSEIFNCFWNTDSNSNSPINSSNGIGKTKDEMKKITTYTDYYWNFTSVWQIEDSINNGFPYLNIKLIEVTDGIEPLDIDNNGFRNISLLEHLVWISENKDSWSWNYELDNDINAEPTYSWNTTKGFSPIGQGYPYFTGIFNGKGHKIYNLYINRPDLDDCGFFGIIENAEISNIKIVNSNITGKSSVGGITGKNYASYIDNCSIESSVYGIFNVGGIAGYNSGDIKNSSSSGFIHGNGGVGGLVGNNENESKVYSCNSTMIITSYSCSGGLVGSHSENSELISCYFNGTINGNQNVGGLVGCCQNGIIINSYNFGNIQGGSTIGGLVGENESGLVSCSYNQGTINGSKDIGGLVGNNYLNASIQNCYNTGLIIGQICIGGIVGKQSTYSTVMDCYSMGKIIADNQVGGIAGYNYYYSEVNNSFWDVETSEIDSSSGGTGKTTAEMKTKSTFTFANWDFDNIWAIDETTNDGYPFLLMLDSIPSSSKENDVTTNQILIYPNPAEDYIEISIKDVPHFESVAHLEIEIYDVLGNRVISQLIHPMTQSHRMNVAILPKGVYFVKIGNITQKFVKM